MSRVGLLGIITLSFSGLVASVAPSFILHCPIVGAFLRRTFFGRGSTGDRVSNPDVGGLLAAWFGGYITRFAAGGRLDIRGSGWFVMRGRKDWRALLLGAEVEGCEGTGVRRFSPVLEDEAVLFVGGRFIGPAI